MKIGINALFYRFLSTGSGQYLTHLLRALAEIDTRNEYLLFGPDPTPVNMESNPRFSYIRTPIPDVIARRKTLEKLVWEQYTAPAAARKADVDLFHVPYFAPPYFARTPGVITIHDILLMRLPLYLNSPRMRAYVQLVARAAHKATLIITVSQHAKRDMIDALHLPAERIRVIYEAAGEEYTPVTDPQTIARVREKYGLSERFIFYLGGLEARKNIPQLVRAFAHLYRQIGDPNLQLFISGNPEKLSGVLFPDFRPIAADLGMSGQIMYRFVEEEDKPAMYSAASLFAFPSLYEGFGLPPLEAMKCGAPVVCSNRTSLPEVVGDAALTFDPDNIGEMVTAMRDVLTKKELEADLRARSLKRAAQFNWRKTAAETLAVYDEAYQRSRK